jgi:hypothetical protein
MTTITNIARAGAIASVALAGHAAFNLRALRRPPQDPGHPEQRISVLVPARDEANRIAPCLEALLIAMRRYGDAAELLVLDDGSTDMTGAIVRSILGAQPRTRVIEGAPVPDGWLGKPFACHQLAEAADPHSDVLVFVDADVILEPDSLVRAVAQLRETKLDLISPYPRQVAITAPERLLQPLLQWSWATLLPLRLAERTSRRSMTAANGQLLLVRAAAYQAGGGHAAIRNAVLDDIELLKTLKDNGFRGTVTDGTELASCRMYEDWPSLRDGYSKSLWSATGSPVGAAALCGTLLVTYVLPPLIWLRRPADPLLALGSLAAVANRALVARRVGGTVWPDSATHPAAMLAFTGLVARSWRGHLRGSLTWKGRHL